MHGECRRCSRDEPSLVPGTPAEGGQALCRHCIAELVASVADVDGARGIVCVADQQDPGAVVRILEGLKAGHDIGLLVVEHDMRLIMRLSDRMVVLNKGQKIAEGTPEEIRGNPAVIEAYIGTKRQKH